MWLSVVSVVRRLRSQAGAGWVALHVGRGNPVRRLREGKGILGSSNRGATPPLQLRQRIL